MALACPPIFGGGVGAEVLDDDLGLLGQVGRVERHEPGDGPAGLGCLVGGVVGDGLLDAPVGLVGRVVGQHVEDEALLDGLAHGVEVEGLEAARARCARCRTVSRVRAFGVAVKAKNERLDCRPRAATALASASSTGSMASAMNPASSASATVSSCSSVVPSASRSSLAASPVWEEWASSTMTA